MGPSRDQHAGCTRCGEANRPGAEFCSACGLELVSVEAAPGTGAPEPTETGGGNDRKAAASPRAWGRAILGWLAIVVGAVGLVIAGIGFFSELSRQDAVIGALETDQTQQASDDSLQATPRGFAPNVLDLQLEDALARLQSLGLSTDQVEITKAPSPLGDGLVIEQVPRPGEVMTAEISLTVAEGSAAMPDVVGLDTGVALSILESVGIEATALNIEARPFVAAAGLVLEQIPPPGSADPGNVTLITAIPPRAPDLAGHSVAGADALLGDIGAELLVDSAESLDGTPGTILQQSVAPGEPVLGPISVSVAQEPASLPLSALSRDDWNRCFSDSVAIEGRQFADGWVCEATVSSTAWMRFDLPAGAERFRTTLTIDDGSLAGSLLLVVLSNGIAVDVVTVEKGEVVTLDVDIAGAFQLGLRVQAGNVTALLAQARVVAAPGRGF